ncbi:MAG: A24 family peptidase [Gammaproteobacteria bacterium]|nr:A24 family peptidase [Gammaproteobacteria bacterium]
MRLLAHPLALYILVLGLGAIIGSFLSMLVYRLPIMLRRSWEEDCQALTARRETDRPRGVFNLALPPSHCPQCQTRLGWLENIPLIGFVALRGRCRHCRAPIPPRYFLIELVTTVAAALSLARFGAAPAAILAFTASACLIALTFIDWKEQLLPDVLTLPLLWLGLLVNIGGRFASLEAAVIGAASGYLSLWLIYHAFRLLTGKEGMGYGDFKLFAAAGAWVGWQLLPLLLLLASLAGAVVGLTLIALKRQGRSAPMPFGPYLAGAFWLALFYGHPLLATYLHLAHGR